MRFSLVALALFALGADAEPGATLYVAPDGNDAWSRWLPALRVCSPRPFSTAA